MILGRSSRVGFAGGLFGKQSALDVVEEAPLGGRFKTFPGDFR